MIDRRTFLFKAGAIVSVFAARRALGSRKTIHAFLISPKSPSILGGARLGAEEANHTARLFDREFNLTVAEIRDPAEVTQALVGPKNAVAVLGGVYKSIADKIAAGVEAPFLEITDAARHVADGRYRLSPLAPPHDAVVWHHDLRRYGAGELNERYLEKTGLRMDSDAWTAWFGVKLIVEAALRNREIASLGIDGHKGVPLRFDEQRVLQQPLYRIDGEGKLLDH